MKMSISRIGKLRQQSSALFLCDMQEKFRHNIAFFNQIVSVAGRILQSTTLDLLDKGYDVHIVADACSSRSQVDRLVALSRMKQSGAFLTTGEGVILQLLQDAAHPKFKEVQKIIKDPTPDSGLLALFQNQNPLFT
ncbi:isochorismatase domain-containing protein 2 isoform X3 [Hyla sarda]|uniref:isochorismatase domain-containing protein 2 isoform X3 n=1 Tax=Hyla sarda TaxID=327740 RepID=UPI0024C321C5|nr:isochorismatase domain-containing protein 2 isoform X3 [Hyla sarda]